jgi:hypothetical protein
VRIAARRAELLPLSPLCSERSNRARPAASAGAGNTAALQGAGSGAGSGGTTLI